MSDLCFHPLHAAVPLPMRMNNPFFYTPHPLCKLAMAEVKARLYAMAEHDCGLSEELEKGKMIGVLVAEDENGNVGYMAAFSGQIADRDTLPGFVPPVFSYLAPDGYFKTEEAEISRINKEISCMENCSELARLRQDLSDTERECQAEIEAYKVRMAEAKLRRDEARLLGGMDAAKEAELIKESQYMKAELRRLKAKCKDMIAVRQGKVEAITDRVRQLKTERQQRSDSLQRWLFGRFVMMNSRGETKNLMEIFKDTAIGIPPSGSGECCEPRLLQYAFANRLKPRAMAMMWLGNSPQGLVRNHESYYPACQGRCKPILQWMLEGIETDPDHIYSGCDSGKKLKILYEDDDIVVVGKLAGILSVPGRSKRDSVKSMIQKMFPKAEGPLMVHRLDMATSGIMVVALNSKAYRNLQKQFATHSVRKKYVAILSKHPDGIHPGQSGTISLPISPDYINHPCQRIDPVLGKEAITHWTLETDTRISLYPLTGRTHQLRLHCAHPDGFGVPIKGDTLYGTPADRLYLHAETIEFVHPTTGEIMKFNLKAKW